MSQVLASCCLPRRTDIRTPTRARDIVLNRSMPEAGRGGLAKPFSVEPMTRVPHPCPRSLRKGWVAKLLSGNLAARPHWGLSRTGANRRQTGVFPANIHALLPHSQLPKQKRINIGQFLNPPMIVILRQRSRSRSERLPTKDLCTFRMGCSSLSRLNQQLGCPTLVRALCGKGGWRNSYRKTSLPRLIGC